MIHQRNAIYDLRTFWFNLGFIGNTRFLLDVFALGFCKTQFKSSLNSSRLGKCVSLSKNELMEHQNDEVEVVKLGSPLMLVKRIFHENDPLILFPKRSSKKTKIDFSKKETREKI